MLVNIIYSTSPTSFFLPSSHEFWNRDPKRTSNLPSITQEGPASKSKVNSLYSALTDPGNLTPGLLIADSWNSFFPPTPLICLTFSWYNRILFSLKMKGNSDTSYNMGEPWGYYAKRNKPSHKRANTVWFHLYKVSGVIRFIEMASK